MQYSDLRVERKWRKSFHARQLSADTVFGATGIFFGAATISKVAENLAAGADLPYLLLFTLAVSQWVVLMLLFGALVLRPWYMYFRQKFIWVVPVTLGCSLAFWYSFSQQQQAPLGSAVPWWSFLRDWCAGSKWLFLSMLGFGVRQPLDEHMTSHFPGILAAISMNCGVCTELTQNPKSKSALHALYRLGRFLISPSAGSLQHSAHHSLAPTVAGFTKFQATTVCQCFFTASQLVLAFALPCLWAMRVELLDRKLFLQTYPLRVQGIEIQFNRFLDVLAVLLLEAAFVLIISELVPLVGQS